MRQGKLTSFFTCLLFLLVATPALAVTSSSEEYMHNYGTSDGFTPIPGSFSTTTSTYGVVADNQEFYDTFTFNSPDSYVTGAVLELKFSGTKGGENWWTLDPASPSTDDKFKLNLTDANNFIQQTFELIPADLLKLFPNFYTDGIFTLKFFEKTGSQSVDYFNLDYAKLTFTYQVSPVPLPGAALLFGSALLGLAGVRRRHVA